jgi:hypothetical protein
MPVIQIIEFPSDARAPGRSREGDQRRLEPAVDAVDDDSALVHHSGRDCRPGRMGGRNTSTRRWFEMTVLSTEPGRRHENEGHGATSD